MSCFVLNLAAIATIIVSSIPQIYAKTININWIIPTSTEELFTDQIAEVGDTVNFAWNETLYHNVYIHPSGTCETSDSIFVGDNFEGNEYIFTENDVGEIVFACDVPGHCDFGLQIIKFNIVSAQSSTGDNESEQVTEVESEDEIEVLEEEITTDNSSTVMNTTEDIEKTEDITTIEEPDESSGAFTGSLSSLVFITIFVVAALVP